jgi:Cu-Zn family superoxide dismutase
MLDSALMKSRYTSGELPSLSQFGVIALLALAAACNRKTDEPIPPGATPPESPVVPRIEPARPAGDEAAAPTPPSMAEPAQAPRSSADEQAQAAGDTRREGKANFKAAPGSKLSGTAKLEEIAGGVKLVIDIEHGPSGKKGIHVHEKGDCSDIPGKSMGEHFAPSGKTHGLPPSASRHLGDMGNIEIDKGGKAHLEFTASGANLKDNDPLSFLDRAIVIHASNDKGSQPSGDSGKPMACAVIEKD